MNRKQLLLLATALLGAASCSAQTASPGDAPPGGTSIFDSDVRAFKAYGTGPETSELAVVPVTGRPFTEALRLTTVKEPPRFYDYGASAPLTAGIKTGDVLWVSLRARRITTRRESGEAQFEVALLQKLGEREVRPLARVLSVGSEWKQFTLPFVVRNDSEVGQARLAFRYGYSPQSVEIGDIRLLNYGPKVKLEDLPRTQVRYDGWTTDAPWRKAAGERIEKYRKGDLAVRVVDGSGKPVSGAQVQVRMKRHAFTWGTAIDEARINDTRDPDNARYRQILETYFNKVVIENDLKWGRWIEPKYRESVLASLPWLEAHHLPLRAHVLAWPSWQHSPAFLADLKNDPPALRKAFSDHITDQTSALNGRAAEWDVINETYAHHNILDIVGRETMVDWFRQARAGAPKTKLFYNDYTMFQRGPGSDYFYDTVKFLKDSGAPIDAIGEQGHFASSPPGIPDILATLDKFGALGLPIQISEFDIDTDDPGLQNDFTRDFLTAMFSHPAVAGVMQWGFWEKAHWLPRAALWDANWNLKPNGKVFVDLTTKTWWTNADGSTNKTGGYKTRAFYGEYEVTVTQGGKTRTIPLTLSPKSEPVTVKLG